MSKTGKRVRTGKRECEKGIAAGQPEAAARRVERGGLKNHRHSEKRAGRKKGGEKKKKGKGGGQLKGSEVEDGEEKKTNPHWVGSNKPVDDGEEARNEKRRIKENKGEKEHKR